MRIAVIIPTYNRAELTVEAVESVLQQVSPADEIWVVDDGSEDDTPAGITALGGNVRLLRQERRGVSAARNAGIRAAQCEWLAFLDSDDLWKPKKLLRQREELAKHPDLRVCFTDEEWRQHGKWKNQRLIHAKSGGWIFEKCLPRCVISPSSVLVHRSVFAEVGLFDESLPACEDYDLWLRVCCRMPVLYIPEKLIVKRAGAWEQLSKQHSLDKYRIRSLCALLEKEPLSTDQRRAAEKALMDKIRIYAIGCRKHGRNEELQWLREIVAERLPEAMPFMETGKE